MKRILHFIFAWLSIITAIPNGMILHYYAGVFFPVFLTSFFYYIFLFISSLIFIVMQLVLTYLLIKSWFQKVDGKLYIITHF